MWGKEFIKSRKCFINKENGMSNPGLLNYHPVLLSTFIAREKNRLKENENFYSLFVEKCEKTGLPSERGKLQNLFKIFPLQAKYETLKNKTC